MGMDRRLVVVWLDGGLREVLPYHIGAFVIDALRWFESGGMHEAWFSKPTSRSLPRDGRVRVAIWLPTGLYERCKRIAFEMDLSFNALVNWALEGYVRCPTSDVRSPMSKFY